MTILYEHRNSKYRKGPPTLVSGKALEGLTGFRSTFGFPRETAAWIRKHESTKGMTHVSVYCDIIFVDFDDEPLQAAKAATFLQDAGIGFSLWDSGNRSIHLHIPITPIEGTWVAKAVKTWVKTNLGPSDLSFYHPAGMFRLGRTKHKKTGRHKIELKSFPGTPVLLTYEPAFEPKALPKLDSAQILFRWKLNLLTPKNAGGRSTHISCCLAKDAVRLGIPFEAALSQIQEWNKRFARPAHSPEAVARKVRYEYGKD